MYICFRFSEVFLKRHSLLIRKSVEVDDGVGKVYLSCYGFPSLSFIIIPTVFILAVQIECYLSGTITVILRCVAFQLHVAEW